MGSIAVGFRLGVERVARDYNGRAVRRAAARLRDTAGELRGIAKERREVLCRGFFNQSQYWRDLVDMDLRDLVLQRW